MSFRACLISIAMLAACNAPDARAQRERAPATSYATREEWWVLNPDGCSNYVAEFGRGSPVVVIHGGFGAEHSYMVEAVEHLGRAHRVVMYDQRGSLRSPYQVFDKGGSLACPDSLVTLKGHVGDLERLRTQLGSERISIVAHSMGALVALSYLEQFPQRVSSLVLLSPGVPLRTVTDSAMLAKQKAAINGLFSNPQVDVERKKAGVDQPPLTDKQKIEEWRIRFAAANLADVSKWRQLRGGMGFYNPAAGSAAYRSAPKSYDFLPALKARTCPTAIILGDRDVSDMGALAAREQAEGVGNIRLTVLPNVGHVSWIDAPVAVRKALDAGLAACGG